MTTPALNQARSRLHADCITLLLRRTVILEGMQLLALNDGVVVG